MKLYKLAPSISLSFLVYVVGTLSSTSAVSAATINTLASFNFNNGAGPLAGLIEDSQGNLFGTTSTGGTSGGYGTVFEYTPGSGISTLASFNNTNGAYPYAGLVRDSQGNLFGTTSAGGTSNAGTLFEYTASSGLLSAIANFDSTTGTNPSAGLVEDSQGNLFGTAQYGGTSSDGTVFKYTASSGLLSAIANFDSTTGTNPSAGLLEDSQGNLFGTTGHGGGTNDAGTIFEYTASSGLLSAIANFNNTTGVNPSAGLIEDSQGNFFGTTYYGGGTNDAGTIFEYTPGSGISILASFDNTNGANPSAGLIEDSQGHLFGTTQFGGTSNNGTVFEYTPGSGISTLASFDNTNGANPSAGLLEDSQGHLFGTTQYGGAYGYGTVFEVVPEPNFGLGALAAIGALILRSTARIKSR